MSNPPTDEAATALQIHNNARASKNLSPLVWDGELSAQATDYANYLAGADIGLQHSSGPHEPAQGENLYMSMGMENPVAAVAQAWLNEAENYHGEAIGEGDFGSFGHYTQAMWSSTTNVGLGWATGTNGWVYVVGRYSPPGNMSGERPY